MSVIGKDTNSTVFSALVVGIRDSATCQAYLWILSYLNVFVAREDLRNTGALIEYWRANRSVLPTGVFEIEQPPSGLIGSYDVVMMIDVLHHTDDPTIILREAARVCKQGILIKDHFRDGLLAEETLRLMDWAGNAAHGVRLPYNYLSREEWYRAWNRLQLHPKNISSKVDLYPFPLNLLFGRELHFIAFLERNSVDDLSVGILPD